MTGNNAIKKYHGIFFAKMKKPSAVRPKPRYNAATDIFSMNILGSSLTCAILSCFLRFGKRDWKKPANMLCLLAHFSGVVFPEYLAYLVHLVDVPFDYPF